MLAEEVVPNRRDNAERFLAVPQIFLNGGRQKLGPHAEFVIHRDVSDVMQTDARRQRGPVHREVGMLGRIEHEHGKIARQASFPHRRLTSRDHRMHRAGRGGIVNHAEELGWQAEPLPQPSQCHFFEFRRRRTALPDHVIHIERGSKHFSEDARPGCGVREISEETRMIPVRGSRQNQFPKVAQDLFYRFTLVGTRCGKLAKQITRLDVGEHRILAHIAKIIRDPVHSLVRGRTKFLWSHVAIQCIDDNTTEELVAKPWQRLRVHALRRMP